MEIALDQEIYYSNKEHLPLSDIAKALLAIEKSAGAVPDLLESLYQDIVVHDLRVYVDELKSGSLTERVKYYFRVAVQKHIEDASGVDLGTLEGASEDRRQKIAGWAIIAVIAMAAKLAANQLSSGTEKEHITQQVNITIQQGHEITGIEPDILRKAMSESVLKNPESVKAAVEFVRPAKRDPSASISIDGKQYLSSQAIAEIPSALVELEEKQKSVEFERTEIHIRATDKDSGKRGWGATIPDFSDRRVRLSVAPGIDLAFVAHHDIVVGNITIFYSLDNQGNVLKTRAHLLSVDVDATRALASHN